MLRPGAVAQARRTPPGRPRAPVRLYFSVSRAAPGAPGTAWTGRVPRGAAATPGGQRLMAGYKVRIADGSEIGPLDLAALRTWYAQGLIDRDSPVLTPGSKRWSTFGDIPELKGLIAPAPSGRAGKAKGKK